MEATARLFQCVLCSKQVIICSRCDRGQRYCSSECSETARSKAQTAAARRYQQSRLGRSNHARRMHDYRRRKQIVTHQGSLPPASNDLLQANSVEARIPPDLPDPSVLGIQFQCHLCGCDCSEFVRLEFLQCRRVRPIHLFDQRGHQNGYSP